jgi:hypothetical protein
VPKNHDLTEVNLLLRFYPKTGKSVACSLGENSELIFLPLSEIEIFETGKFENGKQLVEITMPQWLAEEKGLV